MKNKTGRWALTLAALTLVFISGCSHGTANRTPAPAAGGVLSSPADPAYPHITLHDLDGKQLSTDELRGKVVMLQFWATWCASCSEEIRNLDLIYRHYREQGLVIVAIAVDDSLDDLRKYRETYHIELPILADTDGAVKDQFHLTGLPLTQILDRTGRITTVEDPKTHELTERISGVRDWNSRDGQLSLERVLRQ